MKSCLGKKRPVDCSDIRAKLCSGKSLPQDVQGLDWYRCVTFPAEGVEPLGMIKAFRDQCIVEAVALCITLEVNNTEIAHVVTYLVRRVRQPFSQPVCDLFVNLIIDQRHSPMPYGIRKVFQTQ